MDKEFNLVMTDFEPLENVMLIDDDTISLYLTSKRINKDNFTKNIITHTSVNLAIEYLVTNIKDESKLPNLIFLDINMPGKDGWDFIEEFKKLHLPFKAPIFMLSSSDSILDKNKSAQYPNYVYGFFKKPLGIEDVLAIVHFFKDKPGFFYHK